MTRKPYLPSDRGGERALSEGRYVPEPHSGAAHHWRSRCSAHSSRGMVATAHPGATDAGVEILQEGGNAFDAAAAAAFALGVVEPAASGLGGQTVVLAHLGRRRRKLVLDGSSRAPHRLIPGDLAQDDVLFGHRATTVPSTPATLGYLVRELGTLPLSRIVEPGARLARKGVEVTPLMATLISEKLQHLRAGTAGLLFLDREGNPPKPGSRLRQPALAATLEALGERGVEDFYRGSVSEAIVRDMEKHDGLLHADDLAQIPWPIQRKPYRALFRGRRVFTVGPPGAGRALVLLLNLLDRALPEETNLDTPHGAHLFVLADRQVQRDRKDRPYDPHLYPQVPREEMVHRGYAARMSRRLATEVAAYDSSEAEAHKARKTGLGSPGKASSIKGPWEEGDTTHLSVMDGEGNAVALTQSIERVFGSCEASPELGFVYNNYLSTYEYVDISHPHYLRPGASPWASVAPSIVYRKNAPELVLGSPGSERIVSAIAQVLLRLHDREPLEAVAAPRLHGALDGRVSLEKDRAPPGVVSRLEKGGFSLVDRGPWSFFLGCVQLVLRQDGEMVGVADPRRDGTAGGPS